MSKWWLGVFLLGLSCSDDKAKVWENNTECRDPRCGLDVGADTGGSEDVAVGTCMEDGCEFGLLCNENTGVCEGCKIDVECGGNAVCTDLGRCECVDGAHVCDGVCVLNTDPLTCGNSCTPCYAPFNGTATCEASTCGFTCEEPLKVQGDRCVSCFSNDECDAETPSCENGLCLPCDADGECSAHEDLPYCVGGSCVECKSSEDCGGNLCDNTTGTCTQFSAGSVGTCGECVSSVECVPDHECVSMTFEGAPYGSYCLQKKETECPSPFVVELTRQPVEGGNASTFCGIQESNVTCEAVLDFGALCPTGQDSECGKDGVNDGRCEPVGFDAILMCTFPCTTSTECLPSDDLGCISGDYCGGF